METREMICIGCPMGCGLSVKYDRDREELQYEDITVTGNTCKIGENYAKKEVLHPERMVTSSIPVTGGALSRVPVKTKTAVPKEKIFDVMERIHQAKTKAPVAIGDVIIEDVCGTGVDVVATGKCGVRRKKTAED